MAQISDVMHASAVFDAARQELAWAYSRDFTDVPEPMKGAVHSISEVLNEAQMRWVTSTREEPMAAVVDKENGMAVVATGHETEKKRDDVGVVKEVDTRSIGEAESKVKDWLVRLEEVACDMRAVAQKKLLGGYSRIDDKLSARWLPCLPRRTSRADRIAPTIDTVARDLEELKKQYDSTGLPLAATCMEQPAGGQEGRETSVTGDVLFERDDDAKQRIIDIFEYARNRLRSAIILPIFGPAGVGKTTLVKSVFDEGSFGAGYKVWVDMRKGWGIKQIHESIIELLGRHGINDGENHIGKLESETDYGSYIRRMLEFKKTNVLLVFDNLVEEQDSSMLDKLLTFLHEIGKRVIAIVTTRSEALANYITDYITVITRFKRGFQMSPRRTVKPYQLHPSSDDMCWEIIKRTSGLDLEATGTAAAVSEMVGCEIASKCSGIPIAAKALGRFLQSVKPQEWPGLVRDVWKIGGGFSCDSQQLLPLPTHSATVFAHLRSSGVSDESLLSLAYCAFVFPKGKDHDVVTRDLLNQWCALGITTRQQGTSCILELILYRSLLLGEKDKGHGVVTRDLLKQLLDRSLLLGEKPASQSDGENKTLASDDLSSSSSEDEILAAEDKILAAEDEILAAEDEILAATLRMEDLMHDFARYHLGDRLVTVDGTNGAAPPTLSSPVNSNKSSGACLALVSNFDVKQQLDIASILPAAGILALRFEGCGEMELSEAEFESAKYACLRLLDLSGCSLKKLPHSIRHLKQLRYLRAPGITGLSPDQVFPIGSVTGLHELRCLILPGCYQLEDLTEEFQRLSNLLHLDLSGCSRLKALPDKFGRLWRLERLDLSCSGIEKLPKSFGWLGCLSHLDLSRCSGLEALPESFGSLRSLSHLDMSSCSGLEALPESFGSLRSLSHLDMSSCSGLRALPSFKRLTSLCHLDLSGCSVQQDHLKTSFPYLIKLRHLNLSGLSSLETLRGRMLPRKLRHLNLSGCSGLQELPRAPQFSKLRHLDLSRCSSASYLPDSYAHLGSLVHLNLSGCSSLTKLPSYRGGWLSGGLKHLDLSYCSQLRDVPPPRAVPELRYLDLSGSSVDDFSDLVEQVRSRGGRASKPKDASLSEQGTSGTTN